MDGQDAEPGRAPPFLPRTHPSLPQTHPKRGSGLRISSNSMAVQWSGLSPELLLALDRGRGAEPLRAQLENRLREAVRSGRLRAGERLPSSRELARELGTSRGLVQECYGQLQAEGYLSSRVGSATTVAARASTPTLLAGPAGRPRPTGPPGARLLADFSRGVTGCGPSGKRAGPCPTTRWITATRGAARSCAKSSRPTCAGSARPPPTRSRW